MSGSESIKGFDYQISYSLLRTLEILKTSNSVNSLVFESIDEGEEDFNVLGEDYEEFHQVKKRNEGRHWTPGDLKEIFKKFIAKDKGATKFYFVTDGTANSDVKKLKLSLGSPHTIDETFLQTFLPDGEAPDNFKKIVNRTTILTRFYASDDDNQTAKNLKAKITDILSQPPFELKDSIEICYSALWKIIFDYAREAGNISIEHIKSDFEKANLFIKYRQWFDIPDIMNFQGRVDELEAIAAELEKCNKLVIYGLNGIGKTWLCTKLVQYLNPHSTCWIKIDRWTSVSHIIFLITSLLHSIGYSFNARQLQQSELSDRIPTLLSILDQTTITIVFDSVNSGNVDSTTFIEQLLEQCLQRKFKGSIIITSTKKMEGYSETDVKCGNISEFHLNGFSLGDTTEILNRLNGGLSEDQIRMFHKELGGHPMSVFFLSQLLKRKSLSSEDLSAISTQTIETTRDWIIKKSVMQLPEKDQDFLLRLSLLDGEIFDDEIDFILEEKTKPKYLLHNLHTNHLISYQNNILTIHESISEVSRNLLTDDYKHKIQSKLASFYFDKLQKENASNDGMSDELMQKWGNQVEQLYGSNLIEDKYSILLTLTNEQIGALGAINRFGYPFDFQTEDLSSSDAIIEDLLDRGYIEKNTDPERKFMDLSVEFAVTSLDFWQKIFIAYLCVSRKLPYHMGYVEVFEPNNSWYLQHAVCWWEHCIEFMPLPPLSKLQKQEHQAWIREQIEKGLLDATFGEDNDNSIEMTDDEALEMTESSCPLFGHCCPDGKEQADECRREMNQEEKN